MKQYQMPMVSVERLSTVCILTVSTDAEWGGENGNWDDALRDEGEISTADDA